MHMTTETPKTETVDIATVEQRDPLVENTKLLDLVEFAGRREKIMAALDSEVSTAAEKVIALLPPTGFDTFESEVLGSSFIATILEYGRNQIKFKDPSEYGWIDNADVSEKMVALKNAWAGIIDIEINSEDPYVDVYFKPAKKSE